MFADGPPAVKPQYLGVTHSPGLRQCHLPVMKFCLKFTPLVALSISLCGLAHTAAQTAQPPGGTSTVVHGPITFPNTNPPSALPAGPQDPDYVKNAPKTSQPRQMEKLGRGVVALNQGEGKVWVTWRMLGTEPDSIAFNVYRSTADGPKVKLNKEPIASVTYFQDTGVDITKSNAYFVRPVIAGKEGEESKPFLGTLAANAPVRDFIDIPIHGVANFAPNDCSVGDLDGDGEYELIVHMAGRGIDTPSNGISDEPVLEAYKLDGTFLWMIRLGKNIREGAHYTQFMVYDLDGDGRAEIICKTAPGSIDGTNNWVLLPGDDPMADYRDTTGHVQSGPEYLTVFDGKTGKALSTAPYIPDRGVGNAWGGNGGNGNNDNGNNRRDRFLATIAYLDGVHPSVVMCRGYYGRSVLAAWDWRDGKLTSRWVFDSHDGENPFSGQGAHYVTATDVDGDGRDEIVYQSMVIDDNGKALYSTGLRHGDAMHVGDLDPSNPGLEVFGIHESEGAKVEAFMTPGMAMYDAKTGKVLWSWGPGVDVGRGVAADIDPRFPGAECWCSPSADGLPAPADGNGIFTAKGEYIGPKPRGLSTNFIIYWDGTLLNNLLDGNHIDRLNTETNTMENVFTATGCASDNGSKSTPALSADIMGDWREELVERTTDNQHLHIYVSTMPTPYRMYTLMHDPQYRLNVASQNVAYNQPPHLSFDPYALKGKAPKPNIVLVEPKLETTK